ncbi:MAG TPA: hypothetical protein VNT76_08310, partial [Candidatus Binatus sp.]|nr:hypothetical protein [Candidatus Binatus sp.]
MDFSAATPTALDETPFPRHHSTDQNQPGAMPMRSAVIVSTARTPIGRAYRGAFNDTQSQA